MIEDRPNLIAAMFAAIDGREWHRLPEFFHPRCRYDRPGYASIEGLPRLLHFYSEVRIIADGVHEVERLICCWNGGCAEGRFRGRGRDGALLDERFADLYSFADGKVVQRTTYFYRSAI